MDSTFKHWKWVVDARSISMDSTFKHLKMSCRRQTLRFCTQQNVLSWAGAQISWQNLQLLHLRTLTTDTGWLIRQQEKNAKSENTEGPLLWREPPLASLQYFLCKYIYSVFLLSVHSTPPPPPFRQYSIPPLRCPPDHIKLVKKHFSNWKPGYQIMGFFCPLPLFRTVKTQANLV